MPHDASKPSPLESGLPADLRACESLLTSMPLPRSQIDRDALLYQAGWAAAESAGRRFTTHRRRSTYATGAWSLASAAAAALLTAAVTLPKAEPALSPLTTDAAPRAPREPREPAHHMADHPSARDATTPNFSADNSRAQHQATNDLAALPSRSTHGAGNPATSSRFGLHSSARLLVMRERALFQGLEDPWGQPRHRSGVPSVPYAQHVSHQAPQSITSRALLKEFLTTSLGRDGLRELPKSLPDTKEAT